ncbi:MAG: glycine/betaine ABC transporter substrate-binding protein, partial [Kiloniellales bacterium]|nr:glycine/betaine ABC transporter substrate-binding protein [Kiloniellales bacterium]
MALKKLITLAAVSFALASGPVRAADPAECREVHFSDVGWSCVTATTAIAASVLAGLGYTAKVDVLSVPVTFKSLSTGDIDAFLGLWLPTQQSMIDPYFQANQIEQVAT